MEFSSVGIDDLLRQVYTKLLARRDVVSATRGKFTELCGATIRLSNPRLRLSLTEGRGKPFSACAELAWYLSGSRDVEPIARYIPRYRENAETDGNVYGAYGPRLLDWRGRNQLRETIELLRRNPTSRRAVIQVFDGEDNAERRKDIPCTTMLQFLVRDGRIHMITTMRSNDVWLGLPHDIFCFTMIQELVARSLDAELGDYVHFAASLHLYEPDRAKAETYMNELYHDDIAMPAVPTGDPWGKVDEFLALEEQNRGNPSTTGTHSDPY